MYGSSFRIETERPRAFRIRPMLAAVMPLPREEVTPPVTKTYFAMGRSSGVFPMIPDRSRAGQPPAGRAEEWAAARRGTRRADPGGSGTLEIGPRARGAARALRASARRSDHRQPRERRPLLAWLAASAGAPDLGTAAERSRSWRLDPRPVGRPGLERLRQPPVELVETLERRERETLRGADRAQMSLREDRVGITRRVSIADP